MAFLRKFQKKKRNKNSAKPHYSITFTYRSFIFQCIEAELQTLIISRNIVHQKVLHENFLPVENLANSETILKA